MPMSAKKRASLAIAILGSLMPPSLHCFANEGAFDKDRLGLTAAVALTEGEMSDIRGTGFVDALTQGVFEAVPATVKATLAMTGSLDGSGQDTLAGAIAGFMPALLEALPPGNTVSAQIGSQPIVTLTGMGSQSLSCSSGLACGPGTSVTLDASNPASAHVSIGFQLP